MRERWRRNCIAACSACTRRSIDCRLPLIGREAFIRCDWWHTIREFSFVLALDISKSKSQKKVLAGLAGLEFRCILVGPIWSDGQTNRRRGNGLAAIRGE